MKLYSFLNSFISNFFFFFAILLHIEIFLPLSYHLRNFKFYLKYFVFPQNCKPAISFIFQEIILIALLVTKTTDQKTRSLFLTSITIIPLLKIYLQQEAQCQKGGYIYRNQEKKKKKSTLKMHGVYDILWVEPENVSQMVRNMLLSVFQQIVKLMVQLHFLFN